jgi:hypothetical protein
MQKWQTWLTSLSTPGGNLFVLSLFVILLLVLTVHVLEGHDSGGQVETVILATFSGFSGALLQALRGRSADVPAPPGSTSTTTSTAHSSQAPPEKPDVPTLEQSIAAQRAKEQADKP